MQIERNKWALGGREGGRGLRGRKGDRARGSGREGGKEAGRQTVSQRGREPERKGGR